MNATTLRAELSGGTPVCRWISVTERMPPHGEAVLTRGSDGYAVAVNDKLWGWQGYGFVPAGVTHWMPIPPVDD